MPVEPLRTQHSHSAPQPGTEEPGRCRSFTSQPAPTQWVAVGVTALVQADGTSDHRLLVGTGRTEAGAERALHDRCRQFQSAESPRAAAVGPRLPGTAPLAPPHEGAEVAGSGA